MCHLNVLLAAGSPGSGWLFLPREAAGHCRGERAGDPCPACDRFGDGYHIPLTETPPCVTAAVAGDSTVKFIEPVISEDSAWRQLTRRRLNGVRFLARTVARRVGDNADLWERAGQPQRLRGTVPFLEILWLPYYRVQLAAQSGDRSLTIEALVDGHEATFTPWDFAEVHWVESLDRESFAASIDAATALSVARQGFLDAALRRAEWTRDVRPFRSEEHTP